MTKEQKRIKLAEFDGWVSCGKEFYGGSETWRLGNGAAKLSYDLPDYFGDLNAVRKLIQKLTYSQKLSFASYLDRGKNCSFQDDYTNKIAFDLINKDASQRAEAIGQTLNLW